MVEIEVIRANLEALEVLDKSGLVFKALNCGLRRRLAGINANENLCVFPLSSFSDMPKKVYHVGFVAHTASRNTF